MRSLCRRYRVVTGMITIRSKLLTRAHARGDGFRETRSNGALSGSFFNACGFSMNGDGAAGSALNNPAEAGGVATMSEASAANAAARVFNTTDSGFIRGGSEPRYKGNDCRAASECGGCDTKRVRPTAEAGIKWMRRPAEAAGCRFQCARHGRGRLKALRRLGVVGRALGLAYTERGAWATAAHVTPVSPRFIPPIPRERAVDGPDGLPQPEKGSGFGSVLTIIYFFEPSSTADMDAPTWFPRKSYPASLK